MTPGEKAFEDEAWRRAKQYGDEANRLIGRIRERIRERMCEDIRRQQYQECMKKEAIRRARED